MSIYRLRTEFGQHFKYVLIVIAGIFVIGAMYTFGAAPTQNKRNGGSEQVVAVINGVELTRSAWEAQRNQIEGDARDRGVRSPLQYADMRMYLLQQIVQTQSTLQLASQLGVDVSNDKVNKEIDKAVREYLNASRQRALGKMSKQEAAMDPRDDPKFKDALAGVGQSIDQLEKAVRTQVPETSIRAKLAYDGIQKKIESEVGSISTKDIEDSYRVYNIRQILLMEGKLPKSQVMSKADKIVSAAKSGTDFATLVKDNTDVPNDKATGGKMEYSFDNRWLFAPQLRKALETMKPGDVTQPVEVGNVVYIVKLENESSKMPATLDKKTRADRIKQIKQDREMSKLAELAEKMTKNQKVQVRDPELLAYWELIQGQQAGPEGYQKSMQRATAKLQEAIKNPTNGGAVVPQAKLAQLYFQMGKTEEARNVLYPMLEGKNAITEGGDLRVLLGDILLKMNKKDDAIKQYQIASEVSQNDKNIHQDLKNKFASLGKADLAAAEDQWIKNYDKRMEEFQARQNPITVKGKPAPNAPKPSTPKAGG